jgi:type III secretion system YscQ/HrcQ family protein
MAESNNVLELQGAWRMTQQPAVQTGPLEAALTVIDAATRDALNEWLINRCKPQFQLAGEGFELQWLGQAGEYWHVLVELKVGGHRALLALESFAALDPLLVGEPFTLMPPALRELAVHRFMARTISHATPALANALEIGVIIWDRRNLPDWRCRLPFVLRRRDDGTQSAGVLLFEDASALAWLHKILPVDKHSTQVRSNLPAPLRLSLGRSVVASRALQELETGDVVWIESASIARDGVSIDLIAPNAKCSWRARAWQQSLRVVTTAEFNRGAQTPSDVTGVKTMDTQRWQLDVPVTFDLGELTLKVADLERLQPGYVIELQQDVATATVSLRVADRPIAEGTLVTVGKRLGVRIGTVLAQREPGAA